MCDIIQGCSAGLGRDLYCAKIPARVHVQRRSFRLLIVVASYSNCTPLLVSEYAWRTVCRATSLLTGVAFTEEELQATKSFVASYCIDFKIHHCIT